MKMELALLALFGAIVLYWLNTDYGDTQPFKYKSFGNTSKPVVVVVPGLDGAVSFFSDVIPELTVNYHVVLFYLPLKRDNIPSESYTFEYIVSELVSTLDELHIPRASIVGESFGGVVAQYTAILHPERVDKLVLLSTLAKTQLPPEIQWKVTYLLPILRFVGSNLPRLGQTLFANIHLEDVVEASEPQYVKDLFVREASAAHFHSVMARIDIVYKLDIVERVKSITAPTLLVYGADDHFTRKDTFILETLIPKSTVKALPGGHLAHITSPKIFSEMIHAFVAASPL